MTISFDTKINLLAPSTGTTIWIPLWIAPFICKLVGGIIPNARMLATSTYRTPPASTPHRVNCKVFSGKQTPVLYVYCKRPWKLDQWIFQHRSRPVFIQDFIIPADNQATWMLFIAKDSHIPRFGALFFVVLKNETGFVIFVSVKII